MKATIIPVTSFAQNCTLLCCERTRRAAVVDPGGNLERILAAAEAEGVTIEKILLTHAHIDHAGGAGELTQAVRRIIPPLLNDFIGLQKDTALVSVIGVIDA